MLLTKTINAMDRIGNQHLTSLFRLFVCVLFFHPFTIRLFSFCICHQLSSFVDLLLRVRAYRTNQSRFAYMNCRRASNIISFWSEGKHTTERKTLLQKLQFRMWNVDHIETSFESVHFNVDTVYVLFALIICIPKQIIALLLWTWRKKEKKEILK